MRTDETTAATAAVEPIGKRPCGGPKNRWSGGVSRDTPMPDDEDSREIIRDRKRCGTSRLGEL